nr:MAG TPA: hypothetical protein [Caudoviricetes sp.]
MYLIYQNKPPIIRRVAYIRAHIKGRSKLYSP